MRKSINKHFMFMLNFRLITCLGLALLFFNNSFSQNNDSISLEARVKNLEDYRLNLEKLYQLNLAKLDSSIDDKISKKVQNINEAKKTLDLLIWIGIPGTLIGMLLVFWGATIKAKKLINDKIAKIVEDKREEIIRLIDTQEYDSKLRKNKKLLILSPDEASQDLIKNIIDKLDFSKKQYRITSEYKEFDNYDLIIFNNNFTTFNEETITEFINKANEEHIHFVAYTKNRLTPNERLNFSNSPFTLYHNIISTLKYAEILKLESKN